MNTGMEEYFSARVEVAFFDSAFSETIALQESTSNQERNKGEKRKKGMNAEKLL